MDKLFRKVLHRTKVEEKTIKAVKVPMPVTGQPKLQFSFSQSVGLQREHNEDSLFTLSSNTVFGDVVNPLGFFIVADGMGGHLHGEVASKLAINVMSSHVIHKILSPLLNPNSNSINESVQEIMQEGIDAAHRAVIKQVPGGGTTLTSVLVYSDHMTIVHVGDSRVYQIEPDGNLQILTRDHSLVKRLVELGQISSEDAANHPQKNVLYRALGQGEGFDSDVQTLSIPVNGYILLCTDGLWGIVSDADISKTVIGSANILDACTTLVSRANAAGGPDNITAILVKFMA